MRPLLLLLLVAAALAGATAAGSTAAARLDIAATVTYVVDGDTVEARLMRGGGSERVRLIGIDTPEVGDCMAAEATRAARSLAAGRRVTLRTDATQARRDRYGRLLAYVGLAGGHDLGYELLARGLARVYVYDRPFARLAAYRRAEALGRRRARSVWHGCAAPAPSGRCDPSYPDVCIAPPPPDLDCADVPYKGFRVVGADPHRFDGDGDGIGCER